MLTPLDKRRVEESNSCRKPTPRGSNPVTPMRGTLQSQDVKERVAIFLSFLQQKTPISLWKSGFVKTFIYILLSHKRTSNSNISDATKRSLQTTM